MNQAIRAYRALRYARITAHPKHILLLSRYRNISPSRVALSEQGRLIIPNSNVELESDSRYFLLQGIDLVDELICSSKAVFESDEKSRVIVTVDGVRLVLTCWEELFITHEVFCRKLYNVSLQQPFHVVDVGMNTGTSALFFASLNGCERVTGYELFRPTVYRAIENISLNPHLAGKITANPFGLGAKDETLKLDYFPEFKGSIGKHGIPDYAHPKRVKLTKHQENVDIRAVVPVFAGLLNEGRNKALVCKIDCEGAEYEIMSCLAAQSLLTPVSIFLIEWHLRGPHQIKKLLGEAGFTCLSLDEDSDKHGMLYAFK